MVDRVVKLSPTSPGRRGVVRVLRPGLHKGKPLAKLVKPCPKTGGRNNMGRITVRHRGGGAKRKLRVIDFGRKDKDGILAKVIRLEYSPHHSGFLALLKYMDGEYRYIIAPNGLKPGDEVVSGPESPIKVGNCLPLNYIPVGSTVHCVEMQPGGGAKLARSAGSSTQLIASEEKGYVRLRLVSGEMRKILATCRATIGTVSNLEHNLRRFGKAGARRHLGRKPRVRGVAMNPVDHALGGGEGKTGLGGPSTNFQGNCVKGFKTRSNKRTDKFILKRRKNKRRDK